VNYPSSCHSAGMQSIRLVTGKMDLASAELMETAELNVNSGRVRLVVDSASDTVEDYLHQTTGNIPAQATGSSGA